LKIGGYGMLRFLFIGNSIQFYFQPLVITLCLLSIFLASFIAIRQIDMKRIIAYSSIAHMNFAILGYFSYNIFGIAGGFMLMFSHGIVSSALFLLVGVLYDRYHTRLLSYYGGFVQIMPIFSAIFFLFIISNFSFPGTSNFVGEFITLIGLVEFSNKYTILLAVLSIFYGLLYSIYMYNRIVFGNLNLNYHKKFTDITRREFYILYWLLFFNFLFGIYPNPVMSAAYTALVRVSVQDKKQ